MADDSLSACVAAFITAKKAEGLHDNSLRFYAQKLGIFLIYCEKESLHTVRQVTPHDIRSMLLWLQGDHNAGGLHAVFRAVKCFFRWYWEESEPGGKNPIEKVRAPRVDIPPLQPASFEDVARMLDTCDDSLLGSRDRALLYFLIDTGCRASEVLRVNVADFDGASGDVLIKQSKNGKPRTVHTSEKTRAAIREYIERGSRAREQPLFVAIRGGGRLGYDGLRGIMTRRARAAGVKSPSLHSFRRLFCLTMLRAGVDLITLSRMAGHSTTEVLKRYLAQTTEDTRAAHAKGSPVLMLGR